jgi:hypothetical protein
MLLPPRVLHKQKREGPEVKFGKHIWYPQRPASPALDQHNNPALDQQDRHWNYLVLLTRNIREGNPVEASTIQCVQTYMFCWRFYLLLSHGLISYSFMLISTSAEKMLVIKLDYTLASRK